MSEIESSSSLQSLTETFRTEAFALGINGETVARMAKTPDRALACVREAVARSASAGLAVHMFDAGDWPQAVKRVGTNRHSGYDRQLPPSRREQNLAEARNLMKEMGWA